MESINLDRSWIYSKFSSQFYKDSKIYLDGLFVQVTAVVCGFSICRRIDRRQYVDKFNNLWKYATPRSRVNSESSVGGHTARRRSSGNVFHDLDDIEDIREVKTELVNVEAEKKNKKDKD